MTEPQTINDLDGVFEDEPETTVVEEEAQAEPSEPAEEEESKGEKQEDDSEGEKSEDSAPPAEEEGTVPIAALHDERRKRQEAEERARALENQRREIPNPDEDPEGFARELMLDRIQSSREMMMSFDEYSDYEEKEAHFVQMAKSNPVLGVQMNQSRNPAKFAYETAKEDLRIQKLKDPNYEKDLEARIREKLLAELKPKEPEKKPAVGVPDLTKAASQGSNSTPVEKLEDLDEIFKDSPL